MPSWVWGLIIIGVILIAFDEAQKYAEKHKDD